MFCFARALLRERQRTQRALFRIEMGNESKIETHTDTTGLSVCARVWVCVQPLTNPPLEFKVLCRNLSTARERERQSERTRLRETDKASEQTKGREWESARATHTHTHTYSASSARQNSFHRRVAHSVSSSVQLSSVRVRASSSVSFVYMLTTYIHTYK